MAKSAKSKKTKKTSKKSVRKEVEQKLAKVFADLKKDMGKKKFDSAVKKAGKLFTIKPEKKKNKVKKVKVVKAVSKADEATASNA